MKAGDQGGLSIDSDEESNGDLPTHSDEESEQVYGERSFNLLIFP